MAKSAVGHHRLEIRRTFAAPRDALWRAWTELAGLQPWMCRDSPTLEPKCTHLDVRVDGTFVIEIPVAGGVAQGRGVYRQVNKPDKIVFTWTWKRLPPSSSAPSRDVETLVSVEFSEPHSGTTAMILDHSQFTTAAVCEGTRAGWMRSFELLDKSLEGEGRFF